jgi:hypothetical protein
MLLHNLIVRVQENYDPDGFDPYFIGSCVAFRQMLIAKYLSPNPTKTLQPIYKFEDGTLCQIRKIPRQSHGEQQPPEGSKTYRFTFVNSDKGWTATATATIIPGILGEPVKLWRAASLARLRTLTPTRAARESFNSFIKELPHPVAVFLPTSKAEAEAMLQDHGEG